MREAMFTRLSDKRHLLQLLNELCHLSKAHSGCGIVMFLTLLSVPGTLLHSEYQALKIKCHKVHRKLGESASATDKTERLKSRQVGKTG